ncbi:hypothetical protein BDZ94DRAFT_1229975 [Collybia nuda]|uniref:Uncharacterized protein n=1 Tax=Collybia nuda TaxID=64659 RepID=A0A9P5XVE0_9AGAR|nr:hypothetical protein BDZ94DRAFT_1229975 [Collybia nuda]
MTGCSSYQSLSRNNPHTQYPEPTYHEYPAPEQRINGHFGSHQTPAAHHQLSTHHPRPRSHSREPVPRVDIAHPYARLYAKKEEKRRKIWNHALEKSLFSPYELSTIGAPQRRTIYMSSLEAHIDQLHAQLLSIGFWPVAFEKLDPFRGLNSKTAKSMVAGLQHDASVAKIKLLELERSNEGLSNALKGQPGYGPVMVDNYNAYP